MRESKFCDFRDGKSDSAPLKIDKEYRVNVPCSREGEQSKPEAVLGNTLPQIPSFLLCAESSRFRGSRIFNSPFSTAMPAGAVVASTIWAPPPRKCLVSSWYLCGVQALFFALAAKTAREGGLDPERFMRARIHWMRHKFVRQAPVDRVLIEVVSELAGHASIDTTSIYSTQELARKIRAVQG